jgi:XTP/dITP diphosphohydrolase
MPRRLILASGNAHKVTEIAAMLAADPVQVVGMRELGIGAPPEIEETADDFAGNAVLKAEGIAAWMAEALGPTDDLVLADDSGICIDAFDGGPGHLSARFAGPDANDADNNAKMVRELEARGLDASNAHYACVLAIARVDGGEVTVPMPESGEGDLFVLGRCLCLEGHCGGEVRTERRGDGGFGYDPYFWIDDRARTMAELKPGAKAARSHRGAAVDLLRAQLSKILAQTAHD